MRAVCVFNAGAPPREAPTPWPHTTLCENERIFPSSETELLQNPIRIWNHVYHLIIIVERMFFFGKDYIIFFA